MNSEPRPILVNGEFVPARAPSVAATSRGLMYGDGCFETVCVYDKRIFMLDKHLQRLSEGLRFLGISLPDDFKKEKIISLLTELLKRNDIDDQRAVIRLQVWREGKRGYASESTASGYSVVALPHPGVKSSYQLATVPVRRIPSAALPAHYKFTNGLNYIAAARQARAKGADDALMETTEGWVSETTLANIFWLRNDTAYTPSRDCDLLPGITREIVISILQDDLAVPLEEGTFSVDTIKKAELVWICNSVKEIAPVDRIDDSSFHEQSRFFNNLQSAFHKYRNRKLSEAG